VVYRFGFVLNRALRPEDMSLPDFRPHRLKGDLRGFWNVTVRANWRVIFRFEEGDVADCLLKERGEAVRRRTDNRWSSRHSARNSRGSFALFSNRCGLTISQEKSFEGACGTPTVRQSLVTFT
jgi:hypothetical protein